MPFCTWQSDILHSFTRVNVLSEKKFIKNFAKHIHNIKMYCKEIWVNICVILNPHFFYLHIPANTQTVHTCKFWRKTAWAETFDNNPLIFLQEKKQY